MPRSARAAIAIEPIPSLLHRQTRIDVECSCTLPRPCRLVFVYTVQPPLWRAPADRLKHGLKEIIRRWETTDPVPEPVEPYRVGDAAPRCSGSREERFRMYSGVSVCGHPGLVYVVCELLYKNK